MLGLRFCARAFSSCGKRGPLFVAVHGPLTVATSLVAEHRLQTCRLSTCGSRAQPLRGMWNFPRPGLEPVPPALAGRLSTTAPPGKPHIEFLKIFTCVEFSCLLPTPGHFLRAVFIYRTALLVTIKQPLALGLKLLLWETATRWQHYYVLNSSY